MDKVSVIVPVYNVEQYLSRSLDSIISQTYDNLEIICINDGSTDGSQAILNQYKELDDRIIIYNNPTHSTAAETRNFGIDIATGKYIMFVDSDDYAASIMVENMVKYISLTNAEVVIANYYARNFKKYLSNDIFVRYEQLEYVPRDAGIAPVNKDIPFNYLCFVVPCWNKIYSADFLKTKNLKFPLIPIYEDLVFWADVFTSAERIFYTPDAYYFYRRKRKGSLMQKRDENVFYVVDIHKMVKEIFKKHGTYEKMKTVLDYIMIRDFLIKIHTVSLPYNEQLFNIVKEYNPDVDLEELNKLSLTDDSRQYIEYYRDLKENNFEDFLIKTKDIKIDV